MGAVAHEAGGDAEGGAALGRIPIERAVKAMLPFNVAMVAVLLLVTFVPDLVLALPRWVAARAGAP